MNVRIDKYGKIDSNGEYIVILSGNYYYSPYLKQYVYQVISSDIPLKEFYTNTIL